MTKGGGFGIIIKLTRENERRRTLKIKQRKETKGPVKDSERDWNGTRRKTRKKRTRRKHAS
ncbi:MAG: hypothetical protein LKJ50_07415, partial [Clostridiales bacterium]|nr:hypothetical protein [Clostridiales bacterium]